MAKSKLVALLYQAFDELDRVVTGLTQEQAAATSDGSSFAWTYAHATNQVDAWVNVRFAGRQAHPLLGQTRFRVGGAGAAPEDWGTIQAAVDEVRVAARRFLDSKTDEELEGNIPYEGSFEALRATGINLRYAIMRAIAHHYFHIGEIATKRALMGDEVGDYPGLLEAAL
jgi:hypothetical protein